MNDKNYIEGKVKILNSGNAFIINTTNKKDYFLHKSNLNSNILPHDKVKFRIRKFSGKEEAHDVIKIETKKHKYIGSVKFSDEKYKRALLNVNDYSIKSDCITDLGKFKHKDLHKKILLLSIVRFDVDNNSIIFNIDEILGDIGDEKTEINSILIDNDIDATFSKEVKSELKNIDTEISDKEIRKRRDMRNVCTFTIDPKNSKDFDDALSVKVLKNGNYQIGIHIADVSHYVKLGTEIEKEAFKRGNSIYLVDKVIPMLPHKLSNNICSLNPNEDRLSYSVILEFNSKFEIVKKWIGKCVIHSDKRFSYEEANEVLHNKEDIKFKKQLNILFNISSHYRKKRLKNGLNFNRKEILFKLNEKGDPIGVYAKKPIDTNHIIEEYMLMANKIVGNVLKKEKIGVFRIHEEPNMERLEEVSVLANIFGFKFKLSDNHDTLKKNINKFLKEVNGTPSETMFNTLIIKSQSKAKYSTKPLGHYGLGESFENYTHFTSPIRRYSDFIIHIILSETLNYK